MGKVFRPGWPVPWWSDLAQELAFFPAGKHDDQVDALAYAVTLVSQQASDWDYAYRIYRCQSPSAGRSTTAIVESPRTGPVRDVARGPSGQPDAGRGKAGGPG